MKIGVVGGGQLGQMLQIAGLPLGIEVSCYDPSPESPARVPGPLVVGATDIYDMADWAKAQDVLTYEFENFPPPLISALNEFKPLFPAVNALTTAQDRWAEKKAFTALDIPVGPFRPASTKEDVVQAIDDLDYPVIVKTRTGGYDGKGQARINDEADLAKVDELVAHGDVIVEQVIEFDYEVSVIGVRDRRGNIEIYPVTRNEHRDGILRTSIAPAGVSAFIDSTTAASITALLKHFEYVGVLALEMFVQGDRVMANEMAPRVHNSGHWTIEGAETSQFENHLRAVAGLPLGTTRARAHSAMVNLIGTVPATEDLLRVPGAAVHLYGKSPRPGRKLGHVTVTGGSALEVSERVKLLEKLVD